jgi:hypothetical protein
LALLDARRIPLGGAAAAPLAGPILMRHIGLIFSGLPAIAATWFVPRRLPDEFDLLVYVDAATPSRVLPFIR